MRPNLLRDEESLEKQRGEVRRERPAVGERERRAPAGPIGRGEAERGDRAAEFSEQTLEVGGRGAAAVGAVGVE